MKRIKQYFRTNELTSLYFEKIKWMRIESKKRIPDHVYAKKIYKKTTGRFLNLENPSTFDEKMWYLKLNNRDPLTTKCTDKYLVREYVRECGLEHILNELYGVYDSADEIDFENLPDEKVFIKCNHTSNYNAIYNRETPFKKKCFVDKFNYILKKNHYFISREWNYLNINPKIICEKILSEQSQLDDTKYNGLIDYKFLCFNGIPKYLFVDIDLCMDNGLHNEEGKRNVYDMDFNYINVKFTRENFNKDLIDSPNNFEEMKSYAEILSKPFPFCRVDLYNIDNKVYFGELTFYHNGGFNDIKPVEWDYEFASLIDI